MKHSTELRISVAAVKCSAFQISYYSTIHLAKMVEKAIIDRYSLRHIKRPQGSR